jgi:hypothetical protein
MDFGRVKTGCHRQMFLQLLVAVVGVALVLDHSVVAVWVQTLTR